MFLANRKVPGFDRSSVGWQGQDPAPQRFRPGDAFVDRSLLDGDRFFLQPLANDPAYRNATMKVLEA
jgi:hypothetical protein